MLKFWLKRFAAFYVCVMVLIGMPDPALAKVTISELAINQTATNRVVLTWETSTPSSTRASYRSSRGGEYTTPEYASNTRFHEIEMAGLLTGIEYIFTVSSTDTSGSKATSSPLRYTLASGSKTTETNQSRLVDSESEVFSLSGLLQEAYTYSLTQKASLFFVLASILLASLLFLIEEASWLLIVDWLFALLTFRVWKQRRNAKTISVVDSATHRPIPGAEVVVVHNTKALKTYQSDSMGVIYFSWPGTESYQLRVSRMGYQATTLPLNQELQVVELDSLAPESAGTVFETFFFYLKSHLRLVHTLVLTGGSLLLLFIVITDRNILTYLTGGVYILLWLTWQRTETRPYHLLRVVDTVSGSPLSGVIVGVPSQKRMLHKRSDKKGLVTLAYPLPKTLSLSKKGFQPLRHVALTASAISPEYITIKMLPQPKE